jgi:hypothetical protein
MHVALEWSNALVFLPCLLGRERDTVDGDITFTKTTDQFLRSGFAPIVLSLAVRAG